MSWASAVTVPTVNAVSYTHLMEMAEAMLKYVIRYVLENAPEDMNFFNSFVDKGLLDRLNHVLNSEFGHVTYTEAVKILEENNDKFDYKVSWG